MANYVYTAGIPYWTEWNGTTNPTAALLKSGYVPDVDHNGVDDIAPGNEMSTDMTYVRKLLTTSAPSIDNANNWVKYDASDILWSALDTAGGDIITGCLIFHDAGGADSANIPMVYFNFAGVDPAGADFTIVFGTNGVLTAMQGA
jgi:hypothetical protein